MKCALNLSESHRYSRTRAVEQYPVLELKIHRREFQGPILVEALLDTGFDDALILSRALGSVLRERVRVADGYAEIDVAGIGIPCDIYHLDASLAGRWFRVNSYLPHMGDLGTIVGGG